MEQEIRFCTSADGTRIAYATYGGGKGAPHLSVNAWFVTEELYWERLRQALPALPRQKRDFLGARIGFDRRGTGASQRDVADVSLEVQVADVLAVADHVGLDRFHLVGWVDGAHVGVACAAQHPERVSRLALESPYVRGEEIAKPETVPSLLQLIRSNWPVAQRTLGDIIAPNKSPEERRVQAGVLRQAVSKEVAAKYVEFMTSVDISSFLPRVQAPALLLHLRDYGFPVSTGRAAAAMIPGARFTLADTSEDMGRLIEEFFDEDRARPVSAEPSDVRTILFTDMESSSALAQRLGDAKAQEIRRTHNAIVRDALQEHSGSEIKHTGDGIMASFGSAAGALACAVAIQQGVATRAVESLRVRVGLNAGEPIAEEEDLFGTSVDLASRICNHAQPGQIVVADVVRQLAAGKGFLFADLGEVVPKGFEEPVRLHEVRWSKD